MLQKQAWELCFAYFFNLWNYNIRLWVIKQVYKIFGSALDRNRYKINADIIGNYYSVNLKVCGVQKCMINRNLFG